MKAELKLLDLGNELDVRTFAPSDPENFAVWITASIGPSGQDGAELFEILVTSPRSVELRLSESSAAWIWGKHMLILKEYRFDLIEEAIKDYLESCEADTWGEVALKVARIGAWEFDDYDG